MVKTGVIHAACRNTLFCCLVTASGQMICLLFIRPGETVKTVTDFILGGSKITADGDCSQGIKRCLLIGKKIMTSLDSILKSRDVALPTKVCLFKAMVFLVVMYGCESWTIEKAKHQKLMLLNCGVGEDS